MFRWIPIFLLLGVLSHALAKAPTLTAVWAENGASLDPDGQPRTDNGGSLDPSGSTADEGPSLDPNGRT